MFNNRFNVNENQIISNHLQMYFVGFKIVTGNRTDSKHKHDGNTETQKLPDVNFAFTSVTRNFQNDKYFDNGFSCYCHQPATYTIR